MLMEALERRIAAQTFTSMIPRRTTGLYPLASIAARLVCVMVLIAPIFLLCTGQTGHCYYKSQSIKICPEPGPVIHASKHVEEAIFHPAVHDNYWHATTQSMRSHVVVPESEHYITMDLFHIDFLPYY
jgi:hypothetical protein